MDGPLPRRRSGPRGRSRGRKGPGLGSALEETGGGFHRWQPANHRRPQQNVSGPPQLAGQHAAAHAALQQQQGLGVHPESLRRGQRGKLTLIPQMLLFNSDISAKRRPTCLSDPKVAVFRSLCRRELLFRFVGVWKPALIRTASTEDATRKAELGIMPAYDFLLGNREARVQP